MPRVAVDATRSGLGSALPRRTRLHPSRPSNSKNLAFSRWEISVYVLSTLSEFPKKPQAEMLGDSE